MTENERQIFEPDGRAVPYVDEGAGPALVLVPGRGLDPVHLGTLAGVLIEEDFRVVRVGSRPTQSESGDAITLTELARDVVDVMDHLGIADAWVGGHAFGGTVARRVAREHTDRVNGVLLLAVEGDVDEEPAAGVPVLVIQGSEDDVTPPAAGERLQAAAPGLVTLVTIEGGGHLFAATHAGETAWVIEDYLDWD